MDRWWSTLEAEQKISTKQKVRNLSFRIVKIALKVAFIAAIYVLCLQILAQISVPIPGFQGIITTFVIVYVVFMVVSDLTSGSILQHFFSGAKSLFVIAYFIFALNSGILDYTFGNINLMIDARFFVMLLMLFGLLGLAKSIVQAINFMNEKLELPMV
jgi:hypothetical protein